MEKKAKSSRLAKMSSVPLPWWTSKSNTATRLAPGLGLERGDGHRAEVAESHGPFLGRVMSRRAKQAEVGFAGLGQLERLERAAGAAQCVVADAFVEGCVAVEIVRLSQALEMIFCLLNLEYL